MGADGVVDVFPVPQLTIEFFHLQRARGDLVELFGVGTVGAFDGAVEFGRARGEDEQMQAALLAGEFELGGELTSAIDLQSADGKGHAAAAKCRGTGPRFGWWPAQAVRGPPARRS